jgi:hypothetical protein
LSHVLVFLGQIHTLLNLILHRMFLHWETSWHKFFVPDKQTTHSQIFKKSWKRKIAAKTPLPNLKSQKKPLPLEKLKNLFNCQLEE